MADFKRCVKGYTKTRKECNDLRDDGYDSCTQWGSDCTQWAKHCIVSWIPIIGPMICKVFEWICQISVVVCKASVWVVNMVCHGWKLLHTFICLVWEAAGWVATIPAIFIKLVFAIPIIGAIIKEIINVITGVILGIIGLVGEGLLCGLLGICPSKNMRLCVIITRNDGAPVCTPADITPIVDRAAQIMKDRANIVVWPYIHDGENGPNIDADVRCDGRAWLQDLGAKGMAFELSETRYCVGGALASIFGISSPLYVFVVKGIINKNGCSMGPLTNYVAIEGPATAACEGSTYLAHEMGHAMGLWKHASGTANLMYRRCTVPGRDQLSGFQKSVIRGSKYVQYF